MFGTLDQQVIPRLIDGRDLFEAREQRSKSYSWTVFLTSNIIVEVLWQILAAVLVWRLA
jgi:ABC-type multidrug transport system permease subunit